MILRFSTQPDSSHSQILRKAGQKKAEPNRLRLSATVTSKFFPLYHFFPLFFPLFFHLPQRFPLNTPPILHYHYKISFSISTINFLSTNNYSWTHSTVFRMMNSDTLDLGGERRGPTRRGRCRGHRCGYRVPLQPTCKGRGSRRVDRCGQSKHLLARGFHTSRLCSFSSSRLT
jgi:hypothetical protein